METLQLELHLLDQKEALEEESKLTGGLSTEQRTTLEKTNRDLEQIKSRLWLNGQQFVDLRSQWVEGCWTLEREAISL